jgi:hypothetical protein
MIGLSTLPRAKVVISKGLPVKSSKERVYEHEKATAWPWLLFLILLLFPV